MTGRRLGLLIGNAAFPDDAKLTDLVCPLNDVDGFSALLSDPDRGGFDEVRPLKDEDSGKVRVELARFMRSAQPDDTVLVYYSGHGKLDDDFALHLCTKDSAEDVLEATSIPMSYVWDLEAKCKAERKVILLDCCYSGAAGNIRARGNVTDQLKIRAHGTGTYLMMASDATSKAREKEGDRYGIFTKHLIAGIETGDADEDGRGEITMDDVFEYISRNVSKDADQQPNRLAGGQGNIIIARSERNSRADRADTARTKLFGEVAKGNLGQEIVSMAYRVAQMRPSELTASERQIDDAITAFLAGKIGPGPFSDRVMKAGHIRNGGEKLKPRTQPPRPEPTVEAQPTDSLGVGPQKDPWQQTGSGGKTSGTSGNATVGQATFKETEPLFLRILFFFLPFRSFFAPAILNKVGNKTVQPVKFAPGPANPNDATTLPPSMLNYGLPVVCLVLLFILGNATGGNPVTGFLAAGPTLWNLIANRPALSLPGLIFNVAVLILGGLVLLTAAFS